MGCLSGHLVEHASIQRGPVYCCGSFLRNHLAAEETFLRGRDRWLLRLRRRHAVPARGGFLVPQTVDATYDALDGHVGIRRAVGQFLARTASDRALTSYFAGGRADEMRRHLIELLSVALADQHRSAYLTFQKLTQVHRGLNITDAAFDRVLGHLNAAFVDAGTDDGTSRRVLVALSGMRMDIVSA